MTARSRTTAFGWVTLSYLVATAAAVATGFALPELHPLWRVAAADAVATAVVFGFSVAFRNSSFYDAYWSVAPLVIVAYLLTLSGDASMARVALVTALLLAWGVRLTWNWARGWSGLDHEDWRYRDIREKTGVLYWPVSFLGIHLFPTVLVFGGCLALYPAMVAGRSAFGVLDVLAAAIGAGAVLLEGVADQQLRRFRLSRPPADAILSSGVWAWLRHPNYLGELGVWWAVWLFGMAADPSWAWTVVGPLAMTGLFVFVSIPLKDRRMLARRPHYAERMKRVGGLVPRVGRRPLTR